MDDPLTPMVAPPPLAGSTPGLLQCALCLYRGPSDNPEVITIMDGHATCREHMQHFSTRIQEIQSKYWDHSKGHFRR